MQTNLGLEIKEKMTLILIGLTNLNIHMELPLKILMKCLKSKKGNVQSAAQKNHADEVFALTIATTQGKLGGSFVMVVTQALVLLGIPQNYYERQLTI